MNQAKQHELNIHNHAVEDTIMPQGPHEFNLLSIGSLIPMTNTPMQDTEHQDTFNFDPDLFNSSLSDFNEIDFEQWNIEFAEEYDTSNDLLTPTQRLDKKEIISCVESSKSIELKKRFYNVFTYGKKFKKEHVYEIYKQYISPKLNLRPATRDEKRVVTLFFNNLAEIDQTDDIIKCLEENKKVILNTILKDIDKKKP